ncbi:MAG: glutamine-hydrolyzing GMP synthase [Methanomicrobiales archaeon]|jgi:GMP synthase (glutamine-hydrolysing)|nr:glutamine-hydrolyzing GMP synthase [Methanomicrobiales archaeon]
MVKVDTFIEKAIAQIKEEVGDEKVVIALSGGVDSSVCAALAKQAIGENLICIYVNTGLMRKEETKRITELFGSGKSDGSGGLLVIDASDEFLDALEGEADPEAKRKIVGERFIRIFEREAKKTQATCLLQGTIYPDCIESEGGIKSHHNVGGMPSAIAFSKIIEPLRELYKDEVREIAAALSLPDEIVNRMPFPGPGLSVRVVGPVTREAIEVVREANAIVEEVLIPKYQPWQCLAALIGRGTGVKGDNRIFGWVVAVRAVYSRDGMTADPVQISYEDLAEIEKRITSTIPQVSRVCYDLSPKPPATIEYE